MRVVGCLVLLIAAASAVEVQTEEHMELLKEVRPAGAAPWSHPTTPTLSKPRAYSCEGAHAAPATSSAGHMSCCTNRRPCGHRAKCLPQPSSLVHYTDPRLPFSIVHLPSASGYKNAYDAPTLAAAMPPTRTDDHPRSRCRHCYGASFAYCYRRGRSKRRRSNPPFRSGPRTPPPPFLPFPAPL